MTSHLNTDMRKFESSQIK